MKLADKIKPYDYSRLCDFITEREEVEFYVEVHGPILIRHAMQSMSLRALAKGVGVSPTYLSMVHNGHSVISVETFLIIHDFVQKMETTCDSSHTTG